ncbi:hypothetical protein LBMAG42_15950 [Deltaproteobacteria bacterium]|nr:hypothetical protein LBMAG42_15950 [Deltaproteobacteria bacterium]
MILLFGAALAGPLVVVVREDDTAFSGAIPRLTLTDADGTSSQIDLNDQGSAPDEAAGDHVWSGGSKAIGAGPFVLLLTDGGDMRVWKGSFTPATGDPAVLSLAMAAGGKVTQLDAATLPFGALAASGESSPTGRATSGAPAEPPPSGQVTDAAPAAAAPGEPNGATPAPEGAASGAQGGQEGPPPQEPGSAESQGGSHTTAAPTTSEGDPFVALGDSARVAAWALVVFTAAWVLAGARRFTAAAVEPLAGPVPALEARGVVTMDGDWAGFVRTLAGPFRVLLVGESNPGEVPGGTVFVLGPGRVAVDDILAMMAHLERSGPPVIVVVVDAIEGPAGVTGEAALAELGRRLSREAVVYVFPPPLRRVASLVVS